MEEDEEEVVSKERMEELKKTLPSMFNPGDLAWARLGVAPYWPCTITLDPDQKIHSNVSLRGKKPHREYHVQVNWINSLIENCTSVLIYNSPYEQILRNVL